MRTFASIFLEFSLPNRATWFYLSLLLAVALFFKFSRLLSVRNWDVLALFLLVPGLLLRQEARSTPPEPEPGGLQAAPGEASPAPAPANRLLWFAYLWLLSASGVLLVRCLWDLALVRRPVLPPNLNLGGLAWLAVALFVCLVAVAIRRPSDQQETIGKTTPAVDQVESLMLDWAGDAGEAQGTRFWVRRTAAAVCHLAVLAALVFIGWRHFQAAEAGMAAATFYLLLPYTAHFFEQLPHVLPMALVLWALAAYRCPTVAGGLLGLASAVSYFPALLFPAWLSFYWRRGAGRFAVAFFLSGGLVLGSVALVFWLDGRLALSLQTALNLADWQPWKVPTSEGFWTGVHWAYRIPVFIAYLAFLVTTIFWPAPKNLAHLLALSTALVLGVQFWFGDHGGVYVLWYLPLLLLLVFRPNLSDRQPPLIVPETDWLHRLSRRLAHVFRRLMRLPEAVPQMQK